MTTTISLNERDAVHVAVAHPRRPTASEHEIASHCALARRLAALLDADYADYDAARLAGRRIYYVPALTLVGGGQAEALGITADHQLYGGVVPHAYVATKAISHGVYGAHSARPKGWADSLGSELGEAVLPGYTAFSLQDAEAAGVALLRDGAIRLKLPEATAGRGQTVVRNAAQLRAALAGYDAADVRAHGLVLESNLEGEVRTYSVGTVRIPGLQAAYVGTQELTRDNGGASVYGGSTLRVVRGGYDDLLAAKLSDDEREAVRLARHYDACVQRHYPGLLASRRNYDVALGSHADNVRRMGVLEQSWRAGGASIAEIAALEAFKSDPALRSVTAQTCERYGSEHPCPPDEALVFHGRDSAVGFISKSGRITEYGGAE
ncbi:DUF3182 family protein [Bordetella genomosp. 13]|uniref:Biotin carboxylase n=1 Tax=Bordetella genomosp. 13 TaxID=463040 RepID=A0A1W6Z9W1_9BORD|nr:DUF3182 family protein [Bordetella genomosp. 13]ARP94151.1 hypothetical protein CAL15_07005 [Bordetella genomosp. 13]